MKEAVIRAEARLSLRLILGALVTGALAAPAWSQDAPFVLTHLGLEVRLDYQRGTVAGTAILGLRNGSDRPASVIPLLVSRLMTVSRIGGAAGEVVPFQQDVVVFQDDSSRQVNFILATLPSPVSPGDSLRIVVQYGGILVGYTETGSLYIKDRVSRDFTILREDAYAFPVTAQPSWKSQRAMVRERFTFAAKISVPAGLVVAMGGAPGEVVLKDSLVSWTYRSTVPVPFLNITVAPYRVYESGLARVFSLPADSMGGRLVAEAVDSAVERYISWFGSLGARPRVVVMEIPEGFGSQADLAAGIIMTADAFRDRGQLRQLYHELSHLWNPPDLDHPSPRWNEGLASFLEWRMAAELDGWTGWEAQLERSVQSLMRRCATPPRCDEHPLQTFGEAGLTGRSYSVGMLMFYSLHELMGPDRFNRAYREFFQRYRTSGATTAELVAAYRRAEPRSERVFRDWLYTTRWYGRLSAGDSLGRIVDGYRQP
jgi:hypothetical protein